MTRAVAYRQPAVDQRDTKKASGGGRSVGLTVFVLLGIIAGFFWMASVPPTGCPPEPKFNNCRLQKVYGAQITRLSAAMIAGYAIGVLFVGAVGSSGETKRRTKREAAPTPRRTAGYVRPIGPQRARATAAQAQSGTRLPPAAMSAAGVTPALTPRPASGLPPTRARTTGPPTPGAAPPPRTRPSAAAPPTGARPPAAAPPPAAARPRPRPRRQVAPVAPTPGGFGARPGAPTPPPVGGRTTEAVNGTVGARLPPAALAAASVNPPAR